MAKGTVSAILRSVEYGFYVAGGYFAGKLLNSAAPSLMGKTIGPVSLGAVVTATAPVWVPSIGGKKIESNERWAKAISYMALGMGAEGVARGVADAKLLAKVGVPSQLADQLAS